jgi:hypothetical protein
MAKTGESEKLIGIEGDNALVTLVTCEASKRYLGSRSDKAIGYMVRTYSMYSIRLHYPLLRKNLKSLTESKQINTEDHNHKIICIET